MSAYFQEYVCPWCGNRADRVLLSDQGTLEVAVVYCVGSDDKAKSHEVQEMVRPPLGQIGGKHGFDL